MTWIVIVFLGALAVPLTNLFSNIIASWLPFGETADRLAGNEPIRVYVYDSAAGSGVAVRDWWVTRKTSLDPKVITFNKLQKLVKGWRAADLTQTSRDISLIGQRAQPVSIEDVRISVKRCTKPLGGALIENGRGQGGEEKKFYMTAVVDESRPVLVDSTGKPYFAGPDARRVVLGKDETATITITVVSRRRYCEWTLIVDYILNGIRREKEVMDISGDPFRTTSLLPKRRQYPKNLTVVEKKNLSGFVRIPFRKYCSGPSAHDQICTRKPSIR